MTHSLYSTKEQENMAIAIDEFKRTHTIVCIKKRSNCDCVEIILSHLTAQYEKLIGVCIPPSVDENEAKNEAINRLNPTE